MTNLDKKTTVPLWSVLAAIPIFVGFIFWLSSIASNAAASVKRLDKVEDVIFKMKDDIIYLRAREELREKQNK